MMFVSVSASNDMACCCQIGLLLPNAETLCSHKLSTFNARFAIAAEVLFQFACTACVSRLPLHAFEAAAATASMQHYCTGATCCALPLF